LTNIDAADAKCHISIDSLHIDSIIRDVYIH